MKTKHLDSCTKEKFLSDYKDKSKLDARAQLVRDLDKIAFNGTYSSPNGSPTGGATRGLREYAYGVQTTGGDQIDTLNWNAADIAQNECYDSADVTTTELNYDLFQRFLDYVGDAVLSYQLS